MFKNLFFNFTFTITLLYYTLNIIIFLFYVSSALYIDKFLVFFMTFLHWCIKCECKSFTHQDGNWKYYLWCEYSKSEKEKN